MTGRDLAEVALKVFGVTLICSFLTTVPSLLNLLIDPTTGFSSWAGRSETMDQFFGPLRMIGLRMFLSMSGSLIVGTLLLIFARSISRKLIPETEQINLKVNAFELGMICISLTGVFFLVSGLGTVISVVLDKTLGDSGSASELGTAFLKLLGSRLGSAVVEIMCGLHLIFGKHAFARHLLSKHLPSPDSSA